MPPKGSKGAHGQQSLESVLASVSKQYGDEALYTLNDAPQDYEAFSSGSVRLDHALGIGGYPRGRIVEIYGPESSGKTTMALHAVAEAQRSYPDLHAAFIDAEHALDPKYAMALGVDVARLHISQPDNGEQALEIVDMLGSSGTMSIIVVDSVAALVPRAEIEGLMGDSHVGLQARMMSQALRKLAGNLNKSSTTCLFINQLREKIGIMFGNPETTTGGKALKFYASQRLDVRRIETLKDGAQSIGNRTRVKVVKNKVSPPFGVVEFDIRFGHGIRKSGELVDVGVEAGVITKNGAFYSYQGGLLGQGRDKACTTLEETPELAAEVEVKVREFLSGTSVLGAVAKPKAAAGPGPVPQLVPPAGENPFA